MIVCGLILLAACFNIANFLIGRAASRRSEIALRLALGAGRWRLVRQLMVEATLIGIAAATLGVVVAIGLIKAAAIAPKILLRLPISADSVIDGRMLAVAAALGLGSALVFGLIPAILASIRDPMVDLKNPKPHWSWSGLRVTPRQGLLDSRLLWL